MGFSQRVGGRGRVMWVHTPIVHWCAMHGVHKRYRLRKTLKKQQIPESVQIGVLICTAEMVDSTISRTIRGIC